MGDILKIDEAIKDYKSRNHTCCLTELARELYPGAKILTAKRNLQNLKSGKVNKFTKKQIEIICRVTGVTPDFLFDVKKSKNLEINRPSNLRELRKYHGLTIMQVAEKIHCSKEAIDKIESGKTRSGKIITRLKEFYNTI